uniref:MARVEL domain-containing protein n=1 Tax=Ascaris lumbricoides TaxID=6252 RepID=A0A0M3HJH6_ASCLU
MCLALITEVIALIWTIISMCACCCKQCCIFLLPILALIASIFLAVAVITFGINNKDFIKDYDWSHGLDHNFDRAIKVVSEVAKSEVGYSFYLACGALAAAIVDIIVGALTQALAKRCL